MPGPRANAASPVPGALLLLLAAIALLAGAGPAARAQAIEGYDHRHWDIEEGAPADIRAIAQTRDGFLWLGASTGLYQFDGIGFRKIEPATYNPGRSHQVTALAAAPDGSLWVGYDYGGVARYSDGRLVDRNPPGRPRGSVAAIVATPRGEVWVAATSALGSQLRRLRAGRWQIFDRTNLLPDELIQTMFLSRDGALWLAMATCVVRIAPDGRPTKYTVAPENAPAFAQDRGGIVWLATERGLYRFGKAVERSALRLDAAADGLWGSRSLLVEHGRAWLAGERRGMLLFSPGAKEPGNPAAYVPIRSTTLFRDREGTIWGGGPDGLVNYIRSPLVRHDLSGTISTGFIADADGPGRFYLGTSDGAYAIAGGAPSRLIDASYVNGICSGPGGRLRVVTSYGIREKAGDGWQRVPAASDPFHMAPQGCAFASDGTPFEPVGGYGVFRQQGTRWVPEKGWPAPMHLTPAPDGSFYASLPFSAVFRLRPGHSDVLWKGDAISIGFIKLVVPHGRELYLGGEGLARYDGQRIVVLDARRHPWLSGLTGLAIGREDVWTIGSNGIVRIPRPAFEAAFRDPARPIAHQLVAADRGLSSRAFAYNANDAALDARGRPWLITNRGLVHIEVDRLGRNTVVPPVSITAVSASGGQSAGTRPDGATPPFEAGTTRVQFTYVALSLTNPEHNSYRYRLEGVDSGWVEAGNRRQANYTGLGPGTFRFQVIAANADGTWNRTGASVTFRIAPFFWQTWVFRAALVAFAALLLWALVQWRLRAVSDSLRRRMEDRHAVREHVAREIHDTLLQGFQGLVLRFQSVLDQLRTGTSEHAEMTEALERADDVLQEGRDRIRYLRESCPSSDLQHLLAATAHRILGDTIRWTLSQGGTPYPVDANVATELDRIAAEALSNALRHSGAATIRIQLDFWRNALRVAIVDDGVGIDPAVREAGRAEGHYGLVGMRERAGAIGATLEIACPASGGTAIRITVPASIATAA